MIRERHHYPPVFRHAAQLVIIALILIFLVVAREVLIPMAFAVLFALLLSPLCDFFERNGFNRIIAIVITMLFLTLIATIFITIFSTQVFRFLSNLPDIVGKVESFFDEIEWFLYKNYNIKIHRRESMVQSYVDNFMSSGGVMITGTLATFFDVLKFVGLLPIYLFLLLLYRNAFLDFFLVISPVEKHRTVRAIAFQIRKVVQSYVIGLFTVILIIGVLNSASLLIIGLDYALFFGFLAALLNIVPYVGVFIGSMIPTVYALFTYDSIWPAVAVLGSFTFIQFLEANFITPNITGGKVRINALTAILALITGGYMWGTAGLILFLPYVAMLKVIFENIPGLKPIAFLLGTEIYETKSLAAKKKYFRIAGFKRKDV